MPVFAQNLIDEKNAEIDHLNEQLHALQQEVAENTMLQNANAEIQRLVRISTVISFRGHPTGCCKLGHLLSETW